MVSSRLSAALLSLPPWIGLTAIGLVVLALSAAEATSPEYALVWSDEFDIDGPPSPKNWRFEHGFVRNQELQWYQPENASCQNGMLVIEARRQRQANPDYDAKSDRWRHKREFGEYTSSCLHTRGLFQWKYGRFLIRARIDARPGLWPAIWTLGSARPWPACGEIDIMEYYRGNLLANAAWSGGRRRGQNWDTVKRPLAEFGGTKWASRFHVWRMDWDRDAINLYVDDELLNHVDLAKTYNGGRNRTNPFREPHYLLVNLAIGGTQGGDASKTEFPATFEIDYVRVYQLAEPNDGN